MKEFIDEIFERYNNSDSKLLLTEFTYQKGIEDMQELLSKKLWDKAHDEYEDIMKIVLSCVEELNKRL